MRNIINRTVTGLIFQAQRALPGIQANLAALGYSTAQGEAFDLRVKDAIAARDAHAAALVTLGASRTTRAAMVTAVRGAVMTGRDTLKPFCGREHSPAWIEASFVNNLAVAKDAAGLLRHAQGLKTYLTAHPEQENPVLNITAARFGTFATDLMGVIATLDAAESNVIKLAKDRDAKAKLVRTELSMLLAKLRLSFDPFAAIWEQLGFNRPGFRSVPAIPSNVVAVLVGPTAAAMKWDHAERAERYRIWKKVVGVDQDFVLVETRDDLDFVMEGLAPNAATEVAVSAINSGGESAKSAIVTVTRSDQPASQPFIGNSELFNC